MIIRMQHGKAQFNALNDWNLTPFHVGLGKAHVACLNIPYKIVSQFNFLSLFFLISL